jgi:catechol 2,3-dioxygenase-like lactoylglutathione lyase family enzyme
MQDLIGVTRIYLKHAAILLATGLLFQLAAVHSGAQSKPKRPRITGIDHVRLFVKDVDKSREFYKSTMGFPERGGCIGDTAACFTIFGDRRQAIELEPARSSEVKNWVAEIAFATDNAAQMRRYLSDRGVRCEPIIREKYGSSHFRVADPEGNVIGFVQRDSLSIDDPPPPPPNAVGTRLLHAGFVVKDIAAENRFYVDVLGFKLYWQGGFKDDGLDWYELQVPDGDNWIEYMLNIPATADHKALGAQNHFSFGVPEIQAAAEQLRKNGAQKIAGPGIGRDGKRGLNVYDPDDTRVEVTEFTPARTPCCHPYTAPHPTP